MENLKTLSYLDFVLRPMNQPKKALPILCKYLANLASTQQVFENGTSVDSSTYMVHTYILSKRHKASFLLRLKVSRGSSF
jgi:hypothetical protein